MQAINILWNYVFQHIFLNHLSQRIMPLGRLRRRSIKPPVQFLFFHPFFPCDIFGIFFLPFAWTCFQNSIVPGSVVWNASSSADAGPRKRNEMIGIFDEIEQIVHLLFDYDFAVKFFLLGKIDLRPGVWKAVKGCLNYVSMLFDVFDII